MTITQEEVARAEKIGVAEAKAKLSDVISRVESGGEPCVIMRYNRPVAMVVPMPMQVPRTTRARGGLAEFANPNLRELEAGAFGRAMVKKHANAS